MRFILDMNVSPVLADWLRSEGHDAIHVSQAMTDDIAYMPASELLTRYRKKSLSPVEVARAAIARLETFEGAVNAFVLYDPQTALEMARASEARWHAGTPQGLVDGVPVALKDTVLARGWPRRRCRVVWRTGRSSVLSLRTIGRKQRN